MISPTKLFEQAQFAEASYADFFDNDALTVITTDDRVKVELVRAGFSDAQATEFISHWKVVHHQPDDFPGGFPGYSSTLFESKDEPGTYVLAFRGTADILVDLAATDLNDIVTDGLAIDQIVAMYNDWVRMNTPLARTYRAAELVTLEAETALLTVDRFTSAGVGPIELLLRSRNDIVIDYPLGVVRQIQFNSSNEVYGDARALGIGLLDAGATVSVAGHSLGGHLAMAFTRLFPDMEATTVSGAGFPTGPLPGLSFNANINIRNLFESLGGASSFDAERIQNIHGSAAPDFVTQNGPFLFQPGGHDEVYTESSSWSNVVGHGGMQMTNALAVYDLLIRLDSNLGTGSVGNALRGLGPVFEAAAHDKLLTLESVVNILGTALVPGFVPIADAERDLRDPFFSKINQIRAFVFETNGVTPAPPFQGLSFVSLVDMEKSAIVENAMSDLPDAIAYRYALRELNPFVITGSEGIYAPHNQHGELELANASQDYLRDRAAFLALKLDFASRDITYQRDGTLFKTTYCDYRVDATGNSTLGLVLEDGGNIPDHQSVRERFLSFGGDAADTLAGGTLNDALYGAEGDDILYSNGQAGTEDGAVDRLEGGDGRDTYYVGAGDIIRDRDRDAVIFAGDARLEIAGVYEKVADNVYRNPANGVSIYVQGNDAVVAALGMDPPFTFKIEGFKDDGLVFENGGYGITLSDPGAPAPGAVLTLATDVDTIRVIGGSVAAAPGAPELEGAGPFGKIIGDDDTNGSFESFYTFAEDITVEASPGLVVEAGAGDDRLVADFGLEVERLLGPGPDAYVPTPGNPGYLAAGVTLLGDAGDDLIIGGLDNDTFSGGEGDDFIASYDGDDILIGGPGDDSISSDDIFTRRDAIDGTNFGLTGNDYLYGDAGRDFMIDDFGADQAFGGADDDFIATGSGDDIIVAGDGDDVVFGDRTFGGSHFTRDWRITQVTPTEVQIVVTDITDMGDGERPGGDVILAGAGADVVDAGPGRDVVYGGSGGDILTGGLGGDVMFGDEDNDVLFGDDGDVANAASHGSDFLYGGAGDDYLQGDGGDDELYGGDGDDQLHGGAGDDLLAGGAGDDRFYVGAGAGNDTISDVSGYDRIVFEDGINQAGVTITENAGVLLIDIGGGNTATVLDWRAGGAVDEIVFADGQSLTAVQLKADLNDTPTLDNPIADVVTDEAAPFIYEIPADVFGDLDGELLTLRAQQVNGDPLPAWLHFDAVAGKFTGLAQEVRGGLLNIEVMATDAQGAPASATFQLTIDFINETPIQAVALADRDATEDFTFNYQIPDTVFVDPNISDTLTFTATRVGGAPLPGWLTFDPASRTFSGAPALANVGTVDIEVTATDGGGESVADSFTVTVADRDSKIVTTSLRKHTVDLFGDDMNSGLSLTSDVDLNGDGLADLVIGGGFHTGQGSTEHSQAQVVYGKSGGLGDDFDLSTVTATNDNGFNLNVSFALEVVDPVVDDYGIPCGPVITDDLRGFRLDGGGDFNGDGRVDLIVGEPLTRFDLSGRSHIVFGQSAAFASDMSASNNGVFDGVTLLGSGIDTASGAAVAFAGDVNGDGFGDILIGTASFGREDYDAGGPPPNIPNDAYVVFGRQTPVSTIDLGALNGADGFRIDGANSADPSLVGVAVFVDSAGDINDDGIADVAVTTVDGTGHVIFGHSGAFAPTMDVSSLNGDNGFSIIEAGIVQNIGDINGDGKSDLAAGAPDGLTHVLYGRAGGFAAAVDLSILPVTDGFALPFYGAVSPAGDIDGDGIDDLLIANGNTAYVLFGNPVGFDAALDTGIFDGAGGFVVNAPGATAATVSGGGDINGDGFDDIVIGAPASNGGYGETFVLYGRDFRHNIDVLGSAGDDILDIGDGDQVIFTLEGNDTVNVSGSGARQVVFGRGDNTVNIFDASGDISVTQHAFGTVSANIGGGFDIVHLQTQPRLSGIGFPGVVFPSTPPNTLRLLADLRSAVGLGLGSLMLDFGDGREIHLESFDRDKVLDGPRDFDIFEFADGTSMGYEELVAPGFDIDGTPADDELRGSSITDRIHGFAGDDVIDGGRGDDTIDGGLGNDIYDIAAGDGRDTISDAGGADAIRWGNGIAVGDLSFDAGETDLVISSTGGSVVTIADWYVGLSHRIEQFGFDDGAAVDALTLINRAPEVAAAVTDANAAANERFDFSVPAATFIDPDPLDELTLSAALADGATLPSWLAFDPQTWTFSGVPGAADAGAIDIEIRATDLTGGSARVVFTLSVAAPQGLVLNGTAGADVLIGKDGSDRINGYAGDDMLIGNGGSDVVDGGPGNDILDGGAGGDEINGGDGDDLIRGGTGNDYIDAGAGHDRVDGGDGSDWIGGRGGNDVLWGGAGNDWLQGHSGNDELHGAEGDDTLYGGLDDDIILGGSGDDVIDGGFGGDSMLGGAGNDSLRGGQGDDAYYFRRKDGHDVISCPDSGLMDAIAFGPDIDKNEIWFSRVGDDLRIDLIGSQDSILLDNWYATSDSRIEAIHTSAGSVLLEHDVEQLVQAMSVFSVPGGPGSSLPSEIQPLIEPVIAAVWQAA